MNLQQYAYEARDSDGQLTAGLIAAENPEQAGDLLSEKGLFVVRMAADAGERSDVKSAGGANRAQVAWQMSQLSIMIETGIRLSEALECLARQASQPRLKALLTEISRQVHEGQSLSQAMSMYPDTFPSSLTALIRASEMSGTMSRVLKQSSEHLLHELQVLKRVRAAMMYPLFMLGLCLAVTVFLLVVILPRFEEVFASRHAVLPLPTRMLMGVSDSLVGDWPLWVAALIAVCLAVMLWLRTTAGQKQRDYLLISLPILSRVFNPLYQSRIFRTQALLLDAGVPLVDTMKIIQDIVPNCHYQELWKQIDNRIRMGEPMSGPLLASELIPEPVAQMISSGDRSGKLGLVFTRLADFIEEEYNQAIKTATQFIEPCMVLSMGVLVGFIAASMMLPLFQASQVVVK